MLESEMKDALRDAYKAFADRCDEFIEGEDMSAYAFLMAWKDEVEPRILAVLSRGQTTT